MADFLIITGMSGAGKSTALRFLEDIGYFCVDNLPPSLIFKFAQLCLMPGSPISKAAIGVDIRGGKLFDDFLPWLESSEAQQTGHCLVFLDSPDEVLLKRYKETRRNHPLAVRGMGLMEGIRRERQLLEKIKPRANYVFETGELLTRQLKEQINAAFLKNGSEPALAVTVQSFGFKYGIPQDSDLLFDVRFLPNPFYDDVLKHKTGRQAAVAAFALDNPAGTEFLRKLKDMLEFLLPEYIKEGKTRLVISIGCTGGKQRSVAASELLCEHLNSRGYDVNVVFRDISRE